MFVCNENKLITLITEDSIEYTAPNSAFSYVNESTENTAKASIVSNSLPVLTSKVAYNENDNTVSKIYANSNFNFSVQYDDNGNIISDERNEYSYDEYGQLIGTTGEWNADYFYDERGNVLEKNINGEVTRFSYDNAWLDQLTSVNDMQLFYDENGNMISYGDTEYQWAHGKQLEYIIDGENEYHYQYDANGIRALKTVNGAVTEFDVLGTKILAQHGAGGNMYFQYCNDSLIGFVYGTTQYYYVTNLSGDIVGITDADGNLIAEYEYNEWGKLLNITTAEEGNAEQLKVAERNPFRYRGYYYDSETGMYYLNSRYYNPELGRFISADDFGYLDTASKLSLNLYVYCWNCPVAFHDTEGKAPEISINLNDIISLMKNISLEIKNGLKERYDKLNQLVTNWKNSIKQRMTAFFEKFEFVFTYPDAVVNTALSAAKSIGAEVKSKLVQQIRDRFALLFSLNKQNTDNNEENSEIVSYSLSYDFPENQKTNNWFEAVLKALIFGIEVDSITKWFDKAFVALGDFGESIIIWTITSINTVFLYLKDEFDDSFWNSFGEWSIGVFVEELFGETISSILDLFDIFGLMNENFNGSHYIEYSFIATFVDMISLGLTANFPYLAIGIDMANDMIKSILDNIEKLNFWGII